MVAANGGRYRPEQQGEAQNGQAGGDQKAIPGSCIYPGGTLEDNSRKIRRQYQPALFVSHKGNLVLAMDSAKQHGAGFLILLRFAVVVLKGVHGERPIGTACYIDFTGELHGFEKSA